MGGYSEHRADHEVSSLLHADRTGNYEADCANGVAECFYDEGLADCGMEVKQQQQGCISLECS